MMFWIIGFAGHPHGSVVAERVGHAVKELIAHANMEAAGFPREWLGFEKQRPGKSKVGEMVSARADFFI